jgi:hypothetical protein
MLVGTIKIELSCTMMVWEMDTSTIVVQLIFPSNIFKKSFFRSLNLKILEYFDSQIHCDLRFLNLICKAYEEIVCSHLLSYLGNNMSGGRSTSKNIL